MAEPMTGERLAGIRDRVPEWENYGRTSLTQAVRELVDEVDRRRAVAEADEWIVNTRAETINRLRNCLYEATELRDQYRSDAEHAWSVAEAQRQDAEATRVELGRLQTEIVWYADRLDEPITRGIAARLRAIIEGGTFSDQAQPEMKP